MGYSWGFAGDALLHTITGRGHISFFRLQFFILILRAVLMSVPVSVQRILSMCILQKLTKNGCHADAILGALGQPDIGQLFPDNDPKWKGQTSDVFVKEAVRIFAP